MSVAPLVLVLFLVAVGLVGVVFVLSLRFSKHVAAIASVASVIAIIASGLWIVWVAIAAFSGGSMTVTVPVSPFTPVLLPGVELQPPQATIVSGGLDRATVELTGLSQNTRVLLLLSTVAAGATMIGVSLALRKLARLVAERDPFSLSGDTLMTTAWIVLIGGMAASVLDDIGSWRASVEAFLVTGWSATGDYPDADPASLGWPAEAGLTVHLPFWPLGASLTLALLAAVFRHGQQLRHDTEGLV